MMDSLKVAFLAWFWMEMPSTRERSAAFQQEAGLTPGGLLHHKLSCNAQSRQP